MTPEGKIKVAIDTLLKRAFERGVKLYWHKPVQNGMGAPTLDYVGCCNGWYFTIEAKAPGKEATARQQITMRKVDDAMGQTFLISSADGPDINALRAWIYLS